MNDDQQKEVVEALRGLMNRIRTGREDVVGAAAFHIQSWEEWDRARAILAELEHHSEEQE